jgi:hypothetical protein
MSARTTARRTALVLTAPLALAAVLATASPASAIPTEGMSGGCVQLVDRHHVGHAGSRLDISFGYALVLGC